MTSRTPRGLTRIDILAALGATAIIGAVLAPVLGQGFGNRRLEMESLNNLRILNQVHECYARDWSDRQFTAVPDELGAFGGNCYAYADATACYPPLILGWSCQGLVGLWRYQLPCDAIGGGGQCGNKVVTIPVNFDPDAAYGSFRLQNVRAVHDFLDGRFYDRTFYAPADGPAYEVASAYFEQDCEFASGSDPIVPSSYVLSPAAMYHPDVLAPRSAGGFRHPDTFDEGYASPAVTQVRHADLKSRLIEHHWLVNPPGPCHPEYEDAFGNYAPGCDPYLFNHGKDATPATLFFDGSVTSLRTGDVAQVDRDLRAQSGGAAGLWSRDTPFGADGYFGALAVDRTRVSHHILTTGGILGRDRVAAPAPGDRK